MKRFLVHSFLLLTLALGTVGVPSVVSAQESTQRDVSSTVTQFQNALASNPTGLINPIPVDPFASEPTDGLFAEVLTWMMSVFAWLLGVAMIALNYAVYYTVIKMGVYINDISAIGVTWRILRDVGNIVLIFGFLAIGISTILNTERLGYGKNMLPSLLIAAVFLNFSLFITQAVIDTGNLFATQIYTQINGNVPQTEENLLDEGISGKLMSQLGMTTIYGNARTQPEALESVFVAIMSIFLFIVTAFVFFALALILVARFVILIFLIILAPIGFAGLAVPALAHKAEEWWQSLFQQTITAPILLLLLYIALKVITDTSFLTFGSANKDWLGFVAPAGGGAANYDGFAGLLLGFLVAMGLLIFVMIASKELSAFGASFATRSAGKLSFGATAFGLRATAGTLLGRGVLGNKYITKGALSKSALVRNISRGAGFTGKVLQNRTFDMRNLPKAESILSGANVDAGSPSELTAKDLQEKTYGLKIIKESFRHSTEEYEKKSKELDKEHAIENPNNPDSVKILKKMSADELAELKGIRKGLSDFVVTLSPAKYAELQKSDKLLESEKKTLKVSWNNQFTSANAQATLGRFNTDEIASLDGDLITKESAPNGPRPVIDNLGSNEFEAIRRKGSLTKQQRHDMHAYMMAAPTGSALYRETQAYFLATSDPRGDRKKYWDV